MSASRPAQTAIAGAAEPRLAGRIRIEVFPHSLSAALDFYTRILRFTVHRHDKPASHAKHEDTSAEKGELGIAKSGATKEEQAAAGNADSNWEGGGYAHLSRAAILLGLSPSPPSHYPPEAQPLDKRCHLRNRPLGTELVFELPTYTDLVAERDYIAAQGWPLDDDLILREWGLWDFRVRDPDGWYWRFTTESEDASGSGEQT